MNGFEIGFLQTADIGVIGVFIVLKVRRDSRLRDTIHLNTKFIKRIEDTKVEHDDFIRIFFYFRFSQFVFDGDCLIIRCSRRGGFFFLSACPQ